MNGQFENGVLPHPSQRLPWLIVAVRRGNDGVQGDFAG